MIYPRPYQLEAVQKTFEYFESGGTGNPIVAMPTGTGKSLYPPMFMQRALQQYPDQRMVLLTHVKELIEQNYKALRNVWPTVPASIYSAGLGVKEGHAPIVLGGIATVNGNVKAIGKRDILFIDEAHLLSPNEDSMYQKVIDDLKNYNPYLKVIGLTATPFRMGQGRLTDKVFRDGVEVDSIFNATAFDITGREAFNQLIDDCYLSPLIPKQTESFIDVSDVRQLANDFNERQLIDTIARQGITGRALNEAAQLCVDRKCWIVFAAGIKNTEQIMNILNKMGIPTTCVHSKISDEEREQRLSAFKTGRFRAIVSNNILTTGFDHPLVDAIIDLRPTTSIPLHIQKYGRGTRPYFAPWYTFEHLQHLHYRKAAIEEGGKKNCIVLDFAGNTARLGPINDPAIPSRKKGDGSGDVPIKICPECGNYCHTTARLCECGHEFIFKTKIKPSASTEVIIARTEPNVKIVPVTNCYAYIHNKVGKPPSLRVQYFHGINTINVYLSFQGSGLAKHKAHEWWRQHQGDEIPQTTEEAYVRFNTCRKCTQLRVDFSDKWP